MRTTDQGTRETLSKFWLPLDKFTEEAMAGLIHGDLQIPVGVAKDTWERFEKGKSEDLISPVKKT